jgi:hypothetical protein
MCNETSSSITDVKFLSFTYFPLARHAGGFWMRLSNMLILSPDLYYLSDGGKYPS